MRNLFFLLIILNSFSCQEDKEEKKEIFSPFLLDYIHQPALNLKLHNEDVLKWKGDFKSAFDAYRQIDTSGLTKKEWLYLKNQEIYVLLKVHKAQIAKPILDNLLSKHLDFILQYKELKADYLFNQAMYEKEKFEIEKSLNLFKEAALNYEAVYEGNHFKYAECLNELGLLYKFYTAHRDSSFTNIRKAFDLVQQRRGIEPLIAKFYYAKANILKRDYVNGLIYINQALEFAYKTPFLDTVLIARSHTFKGHTLKKIKRLDEKINDLAYQEITKIEYDKAINLLENYTKNVPAFQEIIRERMILCLYQKDETCFFDYLKQLKIRIQEADQIVVDTNEIMGYYYHFLKKDNLKAIPYYEKYLKGISFFSTAQPLLYYVYYVLIKCYETSGQLKLAEHLAKKNILLNSSLTPTDLSIDFSNDMRLFEKEDNYLNFTLLTKVYFKKSFLEKNPYPDLEKAFHIQVLLDSIYMESISTKEEDAILFLVKDMGKEFYENALATCYQLYQVSENETYLKWAYVFSERLKSFLLYQAIFPRKQEVATMIPYDSLLKERLLLSAVKSIKFKLLSDFRQLPSQETTLQNLLNQKKELYKYFNAHFPDYLHEKKHQKLPDWQLIQQYAKNENTAILQYFLSETHIYCLFIGADTTALIKTDINAVFEEQVGRFFTLLEESNVTKSDKKHFMIEGMAIYKKLMIPINPFLKKETKLLVIPDGFLSLIAFEALPTNFINKAISFKHFPYLIRDFSINYSTSLKSFFSKK